METYTIEDAEKKFEEILEHIRARRWVLIVDELGDLGEIRPVKSMARGDSEEDVLRELQEDGIISSPLVRPEGELSPIIEKPGALARFLESRR
jgi:hypothetical protein